MTLNKNGEGETLSGNFVFEDYCYQADRRCQRPATVYARPCAVSVKDYY